MSNFLVYFSSSLFWVALFLFCYRLRHSIFSSLNTRIANFFEQRRRNEFDREFATTLHSISSSIKAGLSLKESLEVCLDVSNPVVRSEIQHALKLHAVGYSIEDSLDALRTRTPTELCNLAVSSMIISNQVGGNLPQMLVKIVSSIKERERVESRLKALTSQGRSQAAILVAAPPLLGLGMWLFDPSKAAILTSTAVGQILLCLAIALEITGILVTKRVMKLEI